MTTVATLGSYSGWTAIGDYRADAEYYRPEHREFFDSLTSVPHRRLGQIAKMRRPQYRTTCAYDPGKLPNGIKFLSPTEVVNQWVDWSVVREVASSVWDDYPAGRATKGDLLLEVKGDATKVHLLDDIIPAKTMISGSFQQIRLKVEQQEWYVYAVFLSGVWRRQRQRLQSNINIKYVDKEALLTVILPWPDDAIRASIGHKVRSAERLRAAAESRVRGAIQELETSLGWPIPLDRSQTSVTPATQLGRRIDPLPYLPRYAAVQELIRRRGGKSFRAMDVATVNGFENRDFVKKGRPYLLVGNVDAWHFTDPADWVKIPTSSRVPNRAIPQVGDLLCVRTGPVGQLMSWEADYGSAVVGGDWVKLRGDEEKGFDATYFALVAQTGLWPLVVDTIRYGAVHPKVSQDDLLDLEMPLVGTELSMDLSERYRRSLSEKFRAKRLSDAAITDVENLIDGKLDEAACIAEGRKLADEFGLEVP